MNIEGLRFDQYMRVMDVVTRYEGEITAVAYYYDRDQIQYLVEGIDSTGRPIAEWVDERRLLKQD